VRLFDLTQQCIWDCILQGSNKPLGKIADFWRRIEVTSIIQTSYLPKKYTQALYMTIVLTPT